MVDALAEAALAARGWIAALALSGAVGGVALAALFPRFNIGLAGDLAAGAAAGATLGLGAVLSGGDLSARLSGVWGLLAAALAGAVLVLVWGAVLERRSR